MIKWVADKPDLTVDTWEEMPKGFTGIIRIEDSDGVFYVRNGQEHREMGPAAIYDNGDYLYCLEESNEYLVTRKDYWNIMLERFPEKEAEILALILNESFDSKF